MHVGDVCTDKMHIFMCTANHQGRSSNVAHAHISFSVSCGTMQYPLLKSLFLQLNNTREHKHLCVKTGFFLLFLLKHPFYDFFKRQLLYLMPQVGLFLINFF